MDQARIAEAAALLWRTRVKNGRIEALPDSLRPRNISEGYAIQDAMAASTGQKVVGWKIAATSKAGQRHIGVSEPLAGILFADFVLKNGARLQARPLHMRVVETEIAFVMARDLGSRKGEYGMAEVREAIGAPHLAIEIPDSRFDRFAEIGPAQIAADDAFAAWFVLGPKISDWRDLDLPGQRVRLWRNGMIAAEGMGANALGDPILALTWLANHLSGRGLGLKAGDIVTTGICITPAEIGPGDRVAAEFLGLGRVTMDFD